MQVRYYYASCYFDSGVYMSLGGSYLPDLVCCASEILKLQSLKLRNQNTNEDGSARDVLGREVKYRCLETPSNMKRQVEKFLAN